MAEDITKSKDVESGSILTGSMKAMDVATEKEVLEDSNNNLSSSINTSSHSLSTTLQEWYTKGIGYRIPRKYQLIDHEDVRSRSLLALQLIVATSAINTKMLNPNYAIMASPGLHEDSFPNTDPFSFNSATYFLPMMCLLGVAIASVFLGKISDRRGRKPVLLVLAVISGAGSIVKYFTRATFWGFAITQFVFGFFLGNLPVAMAYIGDVFTSKKEKERELSKIVANYVMGNSGGGIIAIIMQDTGLFTPLWVGAGLIFASAILGSFWLIEPGDVRLQPIGKEAVVDEEDEGIPRPEEIDQCTMWNVVGGALADNFGSTALFPLCLSPLALEVYTKNFVDQNLEPIMSITGYQWLSVMVAFLVVPSTIITPYLFNSVGIAGTCVIGNAFTAILTMALLFIASYGPATTAGFAGFVTVMYAGFPVTVFSQLTTGPMLDLLAPADKVGFVQGLNNSAMNFGMAIAPWLFGMLADGTSTSAAIWTGIGISFGAALINAPLMRVKNFGPAEKQLPASKRILPGEDKELVEKALGGESVDPEQLLLVNLARAERKKPVIIPRVKPYSEDKEDLEAFHRDAEDTFRARAALQNRILAEIAKPDQEKDVQELCALVNYAYEGDPEIIKETNEQFGQWVVDYLADNGYNPHLNTAMMKQMILSAFPSITREKKVNPDNITGALVRSNQIMNQYLAFEEKKRNTWTKTMTNGPQGRFYS